MVKKNIILIISTILILQGCNNERKKSIEKKVIDDSSLFKLLPEQETNIQFQNILKEGLNANVLVYEYLYNGGGVATGDFNGDGLEDLYFSSNMGENAFYLNTGGFKFKDVTQISKVAGRPGPWKTGITSADVNGDGKLDLYLCYSGALPDQKRKNQLFINQGNDENNVPIFEEKSEEFGLDSSGFSNQGYFFDYDKDGDLDMLLLNHNPKSLPILNEVSTKAFLEKDDPLQGVRLYEQQEGKFTDVTQKSGISGSALTYGLGIGISDINNDGWLDFYVSNDYNVPDYLYINNQNGTFTDQLGLQIGHTSHFSMGNNIADVNNDGWQDIFTLDMLPEDNQRQKLLLAPDNYEKFDLNIRSGFHHQYMRNMLQLNNADNTFSEIGQLSGISNTDWSWAPLFADFDNDGFKDLFITNGYFRDYTNLDFINYMEDFVQAKGRLQRQDVLELIEEMPSSDLTNYYFSNNGGLNFENQTKASGINQPANSNGAVFVDLDNDGDLDLVVNNINKPAFIYKNESNNVQSHYLKIELLGETKNTKGIGSKVTVYTKGNVQVLEQMPTQGYLSTVTHILHFGLGKIAMVDSLKIQWDSGKIERLYQVEANQKIRLQESNATNETNKAVYPKQLFKETGSPINYIHKSSDINDFKRQPLLLKQFSHSGPVIKDADLNKDGKNDLIIGGGIGQPTSIYLQRNDNQFEQPENPDFLLDKQSYDSDIVVFDSNMDGHLDIYVASGGYHQFSTADSSLQDRIYLGNGKGSFIKSTTSLPEMHTSTGSVAYSDINNDSFPDLFVGGHVVPGRYPEAPKSYILLNNGKGNFEDRTDEIQPSLKNPGMITNAAWADINGDHVEDLVLLGEWMPISIYLNENGKLIDKTNSYFEERQFGLWTTLKIMDINNDDKLDIIAGNIGTNTQLQSGPATPTRLYFDDFDNNGSIDPIVTYYNQGESYPYLTRDELLGQLATLKQKFNDYKSYSTARIEDVLSKREIENAAKLKITHQESSVFLNEDNQFKKLDLPNEVQYAPVSDIIVDDFNTDGFVDVLFLGNDDSYKLSIGKFDSNYGVLTLGDGKGNFNYVPQTVTGLSIKGSNPHGIFLNDQLLITSYGQPMIRYSLNK